MSTNKEFVVDSDNGLPTVRQLVDELLKLDQNAMVMVEVGDNGHQLIGLQSSTLTGTTNKPLPVVWIVG